MASDVTFNVTVSQGGTIDSDLNSATTIKTSVVEGGQVAATVTGGGAGPMGPAGPTGGIVPITVSSTAPSSPNVNDLWIDLS